MSLNAFEGDYGAGKTYVAVNGLQADFLRNTERPVYTNLPCDGDQLEYYLADLTSSVAKRDEIRKRLYFLKPGEEEAFQEYWVEEIKAELTEAAYVASGRDGVTCRLVTDSVGQRFLLTEREMPWPDSEETVKEYVESGYKLRKRSVGVHDRIKEFWYFTKPNAVVFLDESADLFNSLERGEVGQRRLLQSYINHHRHYKDDLYFFMQSRADLDIQVRNKIRFVFYVENSKTVNVFKSELMRGFRWPVQFFRVRQFIGRKVMHKGGDFDQFEPVNRPEWFWPSARKYKNYRSFSAASTLPGKRTAANSARSSDMDYSWDRVKQWASNLGPLIGLSGGLVVALWMGWKFILGMASTDSTTVASVTGWGWDKTNYAKTVGSGVSNSVSGVVSNGVAADRLVPAERLLFTSPTFARSTERSFNRGFLVGTARAANFLPWGIELDTGGLADWSVVLRSERRESIGRSLQPQ